MLSAHLLSRAGNQNDRPAVGMCMCQACSGMHCSRPRYGEQDTWLASEEAGSSCSIAGSLLIAEAEETDALCLQPGTARWSAMHLIWCRRAVRKCVTNAINVMNCPAEMHCSAFVAGCTRGASAAARHASAGEGRGCSPEQQMPAL